MKQKLKGLASFFISGVLLFFIFQKIDLHQIIEAFKGANLVYISVGLGIFLLTNVLILYRWRIFITSLGVAASWLLIVRYFFIGLFCNLFMPSAVGGDVIKALGISRHMDAKAKAFASIILDRLSGFAGIVVVALIAFIFGYQILNDVSVLFMILVMGAASISVVLVLFNESIYSFGCRIFKFFPKVENALMKLHYDAVLMRGKKRQGMFAIFISCLSQVLYAFMFYFLAKGLHQDVSPIYFIIFSPIVCVVSSLPSIGGLGVREIGWVFLLAKVGVPESIAVSISLINFAFMVVVGLIGGFYYVATFSSGRVQHSSESSFISSEKS